MTPAYNVWDLVGLLLQRFFTSRFSSNVYVMSLKWNILT